MTGRYKTLMGVKPPAGSLPRIQMSEFDKVIVGLRKQSDYSPAVLYDIDPARLYSDGEYRIRGRDRASGKEIRGNRECLSLISSSPLFGGKPVINIDATGGKASDLTLFAPPPFSHTIFVVASIAPALKNAPATARLIAAVEPSQTSTKAYLGLVNSGSMVCTGLTSIPAANVPAANVGAAYLSLHGATSRNNRIYLNSNVSRAATTSDEALGITSDTRIGIGGPAGISDSSGWLGMIARAVVFDGVLNDTQIGELMTGAKSYYGLTG